MQRARPSDEGRVKRGQGREMEERDMARELERLRAKELEREAEVRREQGPGHEL